ncbi:unnamed protein product [Musa acuminata subsp. malaccensis]|uniref:(wild Malaysian banana) hypothetical protein n=1 Tax=Musa acuminata subsp. malaccensis TaxID=214687 RepID=A0A804I503_MUSAM|nr:unnamed protein product [Musa acuminata subsp. malaccensis]
MVSHETISISLAAICRVMIDSLGFQEKAARQSKVPSAYLMQLKRCMKNHLVNMK